MITSSSCNRNVPCSTWSCSACVHWHGAPAAVSGRAASASMHCCMRHPVSARRALVPRPRPGTHLHVWQAAPHATRVEVRHEQLVQHVAELLGQGDGTKARHGAVEVGQTARQPLRRSLEAKPVPQLVPHLTGCLRSHVGGHSEHGPDRSSRVQIFGPAIKSGRWTPWAFRAMPCSFWRTGCACAAPKRRCQLGSRGKRLVELALAPLRHLNDCQGHTLFTDVGGRH